jgi:taurine dioxygenase
VLSFADQTLTSDEFEQVALAFGPFGVDPYFRGLSDHPHIAEIRREPDETTPLFAEGWHSDWSFLSAPPPATFLYAQIVPPTGGDTLYADQRAAYDALDSSMKRQLAGLMGVHSARRGYAKSGQYGDKDVGRSMSIVPSDEAMATQLHPLVREHQETGRPALFLSMGYTIGIEGMDDTDAQALLMELYIHQTRDEFIYRLRWEPGMLTMWDNRSVLHRATGGYEGHRRLLHRITIADRP